MKLYNFCMFFLPEYSKVQTLEQVGVFILLAFEKFNFVLEKPNLKIK